MESSDIGVSSGGDEVGCADVGTGRGSAEAGQDSVVGSSHGRRSWTAEDSGAGQEQGGEKWRSVKNKLRDILSKYLHQCEDLSHGDSLLSFCTTCQSRDYSQYCYSSPGKTTPPPPPPPRHDSLDKTDSYMTEQSCSIRELLTSKALIFDNITTQMKPNTASETLFSSELISNPEHSPSKSLRAVSESPVTMVPILTTIRSSSIGPASGAKNNFFRDNSIYECNYETIDSLSSDSGNPTEAILSIEHAVKCIDEVLQKDNAKQRHKAKMARDNSKVQYDSCLLYTSPSPRD